MLIASIAACKTYEPLECIDADGNVYKTVKIDKQYWMQENLRTTRYNNGEPIKQIISNLEWASATRPAFCWMLNDSIKYAIENGAIYNWYVADTENNGNKNVCPVGWHVPTSAEWQHLIDYLGGNDVAVPKLQREGTIWSGTKNTNATNSSGFDAFPSGDRWGYTGSFSNGNEACYWSSSKGGSTNNEAWEFNLTYITNINTDEKNNGNSIRCVANSNKN